MHFLSRLFRLRLASLLTLPCLLSGLATAPYAAAQATSPSVSLGSAALGASTSGTVTFTFSGSTAVTGVSVLNGGAANGDFARDPAAPGTCAATTYSSGQTCTVGIRFTAGGAGLRQASAALGTSSGIAAGGYAFLTGTGTGGILTATPGTAVAITGTSGFTAAGPMALDGAGNLYIADRNSGVVYKESLNGTAATQTQIFNLGASIASIALDGVGNLFLASPSSKEIIELQLTALGTYTQLNLEPCNYACNAVALDPNGNLYYSDLYNVFVLLYNGNGTYNTVPTGVGGFIYAAGIATPGDGYLYVSSAGTENKVYKLQFTSVTGTGGATPTHSVSGPGSIVLDPAGNVYVTSSTAGIQRFNFSNGNTAVLGNVASGGVAIAGNGTVYLNDGASTVYAVNQAVAPSTISSSQSYTSPEKSVSLLNIGNAAATLGASTTAAPFAVAADNGCTSGLQLASNATCALNYTFSPTSGASPQTGTVQVASDSGTVTVNLTGNVSGLPATLTFTAAPTTPVTAGGTAGSARVQVTDSQGNLVTAPTAVTISSNYPGYPSVTANSASGTATVPLTATPLTAAGMYTFTASASGTTSPTANVVVTGAQAATLTVSAANSNPYIGTADTITVKGFDQYGNVSQTGDLIALTSTDSSATLPANFVLSNSTGTGSANVTFHATGTFTVTATDKTTGVTVTSANITVQPPPTFTVTTLVDDATATASNCSNQLAPGATPDAKCSLRDAVAASNAVGFTGNTGLQPTVNFSPSIYTGTQATTCTVSSIKPAGSSTAVTTTAPCLVLSAGGALTPTANLNLAGPGPALLAVSGNSAHSILTSSTANLNLTISGLTLTLGAGTYVAGAAAQYGGALYVTGSGGALTLQNDVFYKNTAAYTASLGSTNGIGAGGALFLSNSTLAITNSTFDANTATSNIGASGGAVTLITSTYTISGSTFTNNSASGTSGVGNYTITGGAISASNSPPSTVRNSSFIGNTVSSNAFNADGGAIYSIGGSGNDTYTGAVFLGNIAKGDVTVTTYSYAGNGGALCYGTKTLTLVDSLVQGNTVTSGYSGSAGIAGGIYVAGVARYLYNTTVTGNFAKGGYGGVNNGPFYAYNSIVYGNSGSSYPDAYNVTANVGSLVNTASASTVLNPMLSAPSNTGSAAGPLNGAGAYTAAQYTMLPLPASPAIRLGSAAATGCSGPVNNVTQTSCLAGQTIDGRGLPRTLSGNVDAGATEANYSLGFVGQPGSVETRQKQVSTVQLAESGLPFAPGNATFTLALSDAAGLGTGTVALSATGLETLTETYNAATTGDTLTANLQSSKGATLASVTSSAFNVTDSSTATLTGLRLSAYPAGSATGVAQTVTVTAVDSGGAPYAAYTGTVTFSSSDAAATLPAAYTFTSADAGVHTFAVTLNTGGTQSLTAKDGTYTATQTGVVTTGYVWLVNPAGSLTKDYASGTAIANPTGGGSPTNGLAFDSASDAWSLNRANNVLVEFSPAGAALSGSGFTGGGLNSPNLLAIDGNGQVWITNANGSLSLFSSTGAPLSPSTGFTGVTSSGTGYSTPTGIAIDLSGNVWVANSANNSLIEVLGGAAPAAPLSTALTNNTTGARP